MPLTTTELSVMTLTEKLQIVNHLYVAYPRFQ